MGNITSSNAFAASANNSTGLSNSDPQNSNVFNTDFTSLDWSAMPNISEVPNRPRVHPVAMQGLLPTQSEMSSYGQSDLSDTGPSDRPTPSSSTPSDGRGNLQPGQGGMAHSGRSSFETSPASSNQQSIPNMENRSTNGFYSGYPNLRSPGTSLEMFNMAEGNPGEWEMPGQGLTPIGEGVFRELMGMGPMDMTWEAPR